MNKVEAMEENIKRKVELGQSRKDYKHDMEKENITWSNIHNGSWEDEINSSFSDSQGCY